MWRSWKWEVDCSVAPTPSDPHGSVALGCPMRRSWGTGGPELNHSVERVGLDTADHQLFPFVAS